MPETGSPQGHAANSGDGLLPGIVLLGCPRSGTSFLAAMLERRFAYAAPVESHFVRYFSPLVQILKPGPGDRMTRLSRAVLCFLRAWVPVNNRVRPADVALAYSLASAGPRLTAIASGSDDFGAFVGRLFSHFAQSRGCTGWVEQSVYASPGSLRHLAWYPEGTKFIHVVRDGRDVWLSWRRTWFTPASLDQGAAWWRRHVTAARAWGREHGSGFLEIRYEDLVRYPERSLAVIGAFIGCAPLEPARASESGLAGVLGEGGTHDRIAGAPDTQSTGRWRREMSEAERARFENIAGDALRACAYDVDGAGNACPGAVERWRLAFARKGWAFSLNNTRRGLKFLLPWWCFVRHWRR